MSCTEYRDALGQVLDGTLESAAEVTLMAHVRQCPVCMPALQQLIRVERALLLQSVAEPGMAAPAVIALSADDRIRGFRWQRLAWWTGGIVAAASVLLLIGLLARTPVMPPLGRDAATGVILVAGQPFTAPATGSTVLLADGTRLALQPQTVITLAASMQGNRCLLTSGALVASVTPQDPAAPLVFATPAAEAQVIGTELRLSHDADGSDLSVIHGRVRFTPTGGPSRLVDGSHSARAPLRLGETLISLTGQGVETVAGKVVAWHATGSLGGTAVPGESETPPAASADGRAAVAFSSNRRSLDLALPELVLRDGLTLLVAAAPSGNGAHQRIIALSEGADTWTERLAVVRDDGLLSLALNGKTAIAPTPMPDGGWTIACRWTSADGGPGVVELWDSRGRLGSTMQPPPVRLAPANLGFGHAHHSQNGRFSGRLLAVELIRGPLPDDRLRERIASFAHSVGQP